MRPSVSKTDLRDYDDNVFLGIKVTRAAADVFDGTQTALFTVAGGKVLVTHLTIETGGAALDAGPQNHSIVMNPTVGTDIAMCAVYGAGGNEVGTIFSCPFDVSVALQGTNGGGAYQPANGWIAPEGTIDLLSAGDIGTGGGTGYCELFIPLDDGATVTST